MRKKVPPRDLSLTALEKLKQILFEDKLTLQPIAIIIGSIINIQKTYVAVNDIWYETESFLDTVSLAFKTFHAFYCASSDKSKNIWYFLQIAAFSITTPTDKVGIKVKAIVKQITSCVD